MDWHERIGMPKRAALARICRTYHVGGLWLFGSVLRDDFRPNSDIDVLVEFEPDAPIGLIELSSLQHELSELFRRPVDLVPLRGLKRAIRGEVLSSRQLLYAAR